MDAWKKVGERLDTDLEGCSQEIKMATSYIMEYQAGIYAREDYVDYINNNTIGNYYQYSHALSLVFDYWDGG